jgi:hypothetical protein
MSPTPVQTLKVGAKPTFRAGSTRVYGRVGAFN